MYSAQVFAARPSPFMNTCKLYLYFQFLDDVSDFVSAFVHKLYTMLSNVVYIVFDVYSVQPVLSGQPVL